jgi:hypothetical protein
MTATTDETRLCVFCRRIWDARHRPIGQQAITEAQRAALIVEAQTFMASRRVGVGGQPVFVDAVILAAWAQSLIAAHVEATR